MKILEFIAVILFFFRTNVAFRIYFGISGVVWVVICNFSVLFFFGPISILFSIVFFKIFPYLNTTIKNKKNTMVLMGFTGVTLLCSNFILHNSEVLYEENVLQMHCVDRWNHFQWIFSVSGPYGLETEKIFYLVLI